jgi:hypothetical protein
VCWLNRGNTISCTFPLFFTHLLDLDCRHHNNRHCFVSTGKHIGHLSKSLKVSPRYKIQWFSHAWILSTPIVNGLTSFFTRYVLAGILLDFGSNQAKIRRGSLKLPSDQLCLAFRVNSSSMKRRTI